MIDYDAFFDCENLTSVTVKATEPPFLVASALINCPNLHIYVPSGSVAAYKASLGWDYFADKISAITD